MLLVLLSSSAQSVYDFSLGYDPISLPSETYEIGNFRVGWNADDGAIVVQHTGSPKILWQTISGVGFAGGAIATADIEESRGFFTIEDHKESILTEQSITSITSVGDAVIFAGTLSNDSMEVSYDLQFIPASTNQLSIDLQLGLPLNRSYLTYQMNNELGIFGFGAQCSYFNHRGNRVPIIGAGTGNWSR